ncbi:MAG TPA: hypothetical protein VGC89_05335 [Pyrinomonadaceae bacterium]
MMRVPRWIKHLEALTAKVQRCVLRGPLGWLLSPRDAFKASLQAAQETAPAERGGEQVIIRDGKQVHILSAGELVLDKTYGELVAPLLLLPQATTPEQLKTALENLAWFQQGSPPPFALNVYWQQAGKGLAEADSWLHCCVGSRQTALDLFLPLPLESSGGEEEGATNFILCCSSHEPAAPAPLTAARPLPL